MSDLKVTVFTRNNCAACVGTKAQFDKLGVPYTEINVEDDKYASFAQMLVDQGYRAMPVVKVAAPGEGLIEDWSGSQPDRIRALAEKLAA